MPPDELALFEALYEEDRLYDEDKLLAARELPPRPWRASQRAVDEILELVRLRLDQAWRQVREQARRERMAAAFEGAFERRAEPQLSRRGLLARLAALQARPGARAPLGPRKLDTVTDDELRSWVRELEAQLDGGAVHGRLVVGAVCAGGVRE